MLFVKLLQTRQPGVRPIEWLILFAICVVRWARVFLKPVVVLRYLFIRSTV